MKKILFLGLGAAALISLYSCASSGGATPKPVSTEQSPADLSGVSTWYVRENGSDQNSGTTEDAPFKTLTHAITRAAATPVKTITVIGTLTGYTGIANTGPEEILIIGKPNATEAEKAVLAAPPDDTADQSGISITGAVRLKLEHITITGYKLHGIIIDGIDRNRTVLTLGAGTVLTGNGGDSNLGAGHGGGIFIGEGTTLIMQDNAAITGNYAEMGGGVNVQTDSYFLMKDDASITGNTSGYPGPLSRGGGGVYLVNNAELVMQDRAAIRGNTAQSLGGGIFMAANVKLTMRDNSVITSNSADKGDGVCIIEGTGVPDPVLEGGAAITGNTATNSDDDLLRVFER